MRRSLSTLFLVLLAAAPLAARPPGPPPTGGAAGHGGGELCLGYLNALPADGLSTAEVVMLTDLREEERLARDIYRELGTTWSTPVFRRIAEAEERHFSAAGFLLERYGLDDPAAGLTPGAFQNPRFTTLYSDLLAHGLSSETAALEVGATIEDLDLFDLGGMLDAAQAVDLRTVLQNLAKGSRNHLRAFVRELSGAGVTWIPRYLDGEQAEAILAGDHERGAYDANGEPVGAAGGRGRRGHGNGFCCGR